MGSVFLIEQAAEVWAWLRKYWPQVSIVAVGILLLGLFDSCGQNGRLKLALAACEAKEPAIQTQYVYVTLTAKANQSVKIVYRDGSPCPDVVAVNDSESLGAGGGSQSQGSEGVAARVIEPGRRVGVHWLYAGQHMVGGHADLARLGPVVLGADASAGLSAWAVGARASMELR
jgi:hypothetical protein